METTVKNQIYIQNEVNEGWKRQSGDTNLDVNDVRRDTSPPVITHVWVGFKKK